MSQAKPELLKKLSKYSKEDIIEALGRNYQADYIVTGILNDLENRATKKAFADYDKALDDLKAAQEACYNWRIEMVDKYGGGNNVHLKDIPQEEIKHGAALERAAEKAEETVQRLDKKINKLTKTEAYND